MKTVGTTLGGRYGLSEPFFVNYEGRHDDEQDLRFLLDISVGIVTRRAEENAHRRSFELVRKSARS